MHEGSAFTNHKDDSGGPTKYGITLTVLIAWRGRATVKDLQALTADEAAAIYRSLYIRPFDRLPASWLRVNVIDMGVNAGVRRAAMLLQQVIGASVDGWIGNETVSKAGVFQADTANTLYVGARLVFYENLIQTAPKNLTWRAGWRRRALSFLEAPVTGLKASGRRGGAAAGLFGATGKAFW